MVSFRWLLGLAFSAALLDLPEVPVVVQMPIENETYPCGLLHPVVSLGISDDLAVHVLRSRSWLLCYALTAANGSSEERCAPLGSKLLHAMWAPESGRWKFELWLTYLADGKTLRGTGRISRLFWTSCHSRRRESAALERARNLELVGCSHPPVALGNLARFSEDNGSLSFSTLDGEAPSRPLAIFLRLAPRSEARLRSKNALYAYDGPVDKRSLPQLACVAALAIALAQLTERQQASTSVLLLPNGFDEGNERVGRWVQARLGIAATVVPDTPAGNSESFDYMSSLVSTLDDESTIVFALEDDVILQPTALVEMVDLFQSHEPCLCYPIDSPLLYSGDAHFVGVGAEPAEVIAARHRHWRTSPSTTSTFATSLGIYKALLAYDLLPHPSHDFEHSNALATALPGSILSPLPGLATSIERLDRFAETHVAFYFNYVRFAKNILADLEADDTIPSFLIQE